MNNSNTKQAEQLNETAVMQSVLKSSDLRIGCIIEKSGDICSVASINLDNTIRIFNEDKTDTWGCFALRIFNPIPLTDEWLKKLGFKQDIGEHERFFNDFISFSKYGIHRVIEYNGFDFTITYVHQLQNLHFALTQRELTVA
jgi:hypothetical protein